MIGLGLWLGAGVAAAAETWWVADPALEAPLRAALDALWPERAGRVEVRVGAPASDPGGVRWDGATVSAWDGSRIRRAPADEAAVAVLLARTWALPADPGGPERIAFLPAPPPATPPPARPAAAAPGWRWSVGMGLRAMPGPRWVDGIRAVAALAPPDERVAVEVGVAGAPAPGATLPVTDGAVRDVWVDRATAGVAAAVVPARIGPVAVRLTGGPEVRWVEHWLYVDGQRETASGSWARLAGVAGIGGSVAVGRWTVAATGLGRVSAGEGPVADGGIEVDVRYRSR